MTHKVCEDSVKHPEQRLIYSKLHDPLDSSIVADARVGEVCWDVSEIDRGMLVVCVTIVLTSRSVMDFLISSFSRFLPTLINVI